MKKLALTSLLAFFAVSGAHAANIIDGNPLYRPGEGHFYSNFAVESHSEAIEDWKIAEEFGYGITNELKLFMKTGVSETEGFDYMSWNDFTVGLDYRVLDDVNWKADVYGVYALNPVWGDHKPFLDEDMTGYTWTLGARAGYVGAGWTVAGHIDFDYLNSESFNWGDDGVHKLSVGVDGQLVLCPKWNLIAGVEYTGTLDDEIAGIDVEDAGKWTGKFGANYNLDETKYIGAYIMGEMAHATGDWEFADGFGFGVNFGIDF
ncbi:MAG: hypothetical protein IJD41_01650 [Alphaproteobacteria bacterium]|nr:hypothetical protein [Alphaproteobacteria bacterium]MBQ7127440.1 hypothetical protein [Alphaproteobacteria bacterium]